jgi:hypothetical protein
MNLAIIGIVGNTLYFEPFYAGDNEHDAVLSNDEKESFLENGVKEFPNYIHIQARLFGKTYEEFMDMCDNWHREEKIRKNTPTIPREKSELPF